MGLTVREKKADRPRYWLAFLLKDLAIGDTFRPDTLHLTIATWFVTELPDAEVKASFYRHFQNLKAFEISVGRQEDFKNTHKVSTNLVGPSRRITRLHRTALDWLVEIEARWAVRKPYVGPEFKPHIRRRRGRNLSEGESLMFSSLSLVSARRRGDSERTVVAKVNFNG